MMLVYVVLDIHDDLAYLLCYTDGRLFVEQWNGHDKIGVVSARYNELEECR